MASMRTEAESLAIGLELGIVPVSDAVAWADRQIEQSDVPCNAICEISMASSKSPHDVVHLLRSLPGEFNASVAVRSTVGHLLIALRDLDYDPESIARALYDLAMADDLPDGPMKTQAWWYWDAIGLSRDGIGHETVDEIRSMMVQEMSDFVGGDPER